VAELGFELWIGDPAEIKAKRVKKQKFDREDARLLLRLLRENNSKKQDVAEFHRNLLSPEGKSRRGGSHQSI
jgi:hypothetical protein